MATPASSPASTAATPPSFSVWLEGVRVGARCLPVDPRIGLARLILPVSYWRYAEFRYVVGALDCAPGARVLDVGSPKDLALFLARRRQYAVVATDIMPDATARSQRAATAAGVAGDGPGRVVSDTQDARTLPYDDNSFDAAYSVSVLEHIPESGDTAAIEELVRVVRPGGAVVITTPYSTKYRETMVDHSVYERQAGAPGDPVFYERHYDHTSLAKRLIDPSGARLVDLQIWGEGPARIERALTRIGGLRTALSPLEPLLATLFLRRTEGNAENSMAVFFTLRKP